MEKFQLEVVFDFCGDSQFYHGHGHAFCSDKVVACIPFGIYVSGHETVKEIIEAIIEDINSRIDPITFLNAAEKDETLQEQIREYLTDQIIEQALKEEIGLDVKPEEKFFDTEPEEETEEDEIALDGDMLIGYIHVWHE